MAGNANAESLDFTNVKDGGGQWSKTRFPTGDYKGRVTAVESTAPKNDPTAKMWVFTIEVKHEGKLGSYPLYCKLVPEQLWKIRSLWAAAGLVIPKKRMKIDPNKIVGKYIGVTLEEEEYNGRLQSKAQYTLPLDKIQPNDEAEGDVEDEDLEDEEEEEETPAPPARRRKPAPEPEPEEEEEEEAEEEAEEEEEEEEEPPAPPARKKAAARRVAPESTPAKVRTRSSKRPAVSVDDDDLEDLDLEGL